jgi:hypothetical protein
MQPGLEEIWSDESVSIDTMYIQRKHVLGSSLVRLSIWNASETCAPN